MIVNINDFEDGKELYFYFYSFKKDGKGDCYLGITDNIDDITNYKNKIYKVVLKESNLNYCLEAREKLKDKMVKRISKRLNEKHNT